MQHFSDGLSTLVLAYVVSVVGSLIGLACMARAQAEPSRAAKARWTVFGGYTFLDAVIVDGGFTAFVLPAGGGVAARTVLEPSVNTGRRFPQTARHGAAAGVIDGMLHVVGGGQSAGASASSVHEVLALPEAP